MEDIQGKLVELHASVFEFSAASRHPLVTRLVWDFEQDFWIRWIAALPNNEAMIDAISEDVIEDRLEEIGVLGGDSRLDVDFGWKTTEGDVDEAYRAAQREITQLNQVGRYGVVSDDIGPNGRGTVHIRNDLHEKLGKRPPTNQGPEGTFPAVLWDDPVKARQIVRVMGTTSKGLEVQPARDEHYNLVFTWIECGLLTS